MLHTAPIQRLSEDQFGTAPLVRRLVERVLVRGSTSTLVAVHARWGAGKTSVLNMAGDLAKGIRQPNPDYRSALWTPIFPTWRYEGAASLEQALLWHMQKSLPREVAEDESLLFRVTRVAMTLAYAGVNVAGNMAQMGDVANHLVAGHDLAKRLLPHPSIVSGLPGFSECETADRIASAFNSFADLACSKLGIDMLVVPVDDMDRCRPEQAVAFLFALKNLLISPRICFLVAIDRYAMARFLSLTYGQAFKAEDATWFLEKVFDDWVDIPPPPTKSILERADFPSSAPQELRQAFMVLCTATGIMGVASNPRRLIRGVHRFERFLKSHSHESLAALSPEFLVGCLGWSILYGSSPEQVDAVSEMRGFAGEQDGFRSVCALLVLIDKARQEGIAAVQTTTGGSMGRLQTEVLRLAMGTGTAALGSLSGIIPGLGSLLGALGSNERIEERALQDAVTRIQACLPEALREHVGDYNSGLMRLVHSLTTQREGGNLVLNSDGIADSLEAIRPYF